MSARRKKNKGPTEANLHKSVADLLRHVLKPPVIWTTIGHGGGGKIRGAHLKAMGVQKGWPDILIMWPDEEGPQVLGIELKVKDGRMTPEQRQMFMDFTSALCTYVVCRSVDDVQRSLVGFEVPHTPMVLS